MKAAREQVASFDQRPRTPGFDTMAAVNGARSPPQGPEPVLRRSASFSADNKRKREDDEVRPHRSGTSSRSAQTQKDILEILQQYEALASDWYA